MELLETREIIQPTGFYFVHVYPVDDSTEDKFEIHVAPDRSQPQNEAAAALRFRDLGELADCLEALGCNAWHRFLGEAPLGQPLFEIVPMAVEKSIDFLSENPPRPNWDSITLLALGTRVAQMRERLDKWRGRATKC